MFFRVPVGFLNIYSALLLVLFGGFLLFLLPYFPQQWFVVQGIILLLFLVISSRWVQLSLAILWLSFFLKTATQIVPPSELYRFYQRVNPSLTRIFVADFKEAAFVESYRDIWGRQHVFFNEGWLNDDNIFFENSLFEIMSLYKKTLPVFSSKLSDVAYVGALTDLECSHLRAIEFNVSSAYELEIFKGVPVCGSAIELGPLEQVLKNYSHLMFFSHTPSSLIEKNIVEIQKKGSRLKSIWDCRFNQDAPNLNVEKFPLSEKDSVRVISFKFHSRQCYVYMCMNSTQTQQWNQLPFIKRMSIWQDKD